MCLTPRRHSGNNAKTAKRGEFKTRKLQEEKEMNKLFLFIVVMLFVVVPASAQADRYDVVLGDLQEAIRLCGAIPDVNIEATTPYEPQQLSSVKSYTEIKTVHVKSLSCMITSAEEYKSRGGYGWVVTPKGSKYGVTTSGKYYFEGAEGGGYKKCHNHTPAVLVEKQVQETVSLVINQAAQATQETITVKETILCPSGYLDEKTKQCYVPPVCPTCPIYNYTPIKEGVVNKNTYISAGAGAAGGFAVSRGGWKDRAIGAGISGGASFLTNVLVRMPKGNRGDKAGIFTVQYPGQAPQSTTVKRGEDGNIGNATFKWNGSGWTLSAPDCAPSFVNPAVAVTITPIVIPWIGKNKVAKKKLPPTPVVSPSFPPLGGTNPPVHTPPNGGPITVITPNAGTTLPIRRFTRQ